jgi:hypothetical protein
MATSVGGEDRETEKALPRKDTPNIAVPLRSVALVSDSNFLARNSPIGPASPKDVPGSGEVAWPSTDISGSRDGSQSDTWSVDTPRGNANEREGNFALQERRYRERDREKGRDLERESEGKEKEKDEKEVVEQRHSRRKSRRASPSHQSSEEFSGHDTAGNKYVRSFGYLITDYLL